MSGSERAPLPLTLKKNERERWNERKSVLSEKRAIARKRAESGSSAQSTPTTQVGLKKKTTYMKSKQSPLTLVWLRIIISKVLTAHPKYKKVWFKKKKRKPKRAPSTLQPLKLQRTTTTALPDLANATARAHTHDPASASPPDHVRPFGLNEFFVILIENS